MNQPAGIPEIGFLDPAVLADPAAIHAMSRDIGPLVKLPDRNVYGVLSAELADEVLTRVDDFASGWPQIIMGRYQDDPEIQAIAAQGVAHRDVLLSLDPPDHTHQRKLVNMAFSKPRVDAMAAEIREIAIRLIEGFKDKGRCDFIAEFAVPLPVRMIAQQYGIADVPDESVKRWSDACIQRGGSVASREQEIEFARAIVEFHQVMLEKIDERRRSEYDDLLYDLVNAEVAGERPLTDEELIATLELLITAGNETTTSALGMGMLMLLEMPEKMALIRGDKSKIPVMVEEMLRLEPPATGTWRVARHDTELGGVAIPAGTQMMIRLATANRDGAMFALPDQADAERRNAHRHFSFGRGVHTCIGNMLARREMAIAFEELVDRLDDITLPEQEREYTTTAITRGLKRLEIGFHARS